MQIEFLPITGPVELMPRIFHDDRGYFFESFSQKLFDEKVSKTLFVQDNESRSIRGVVRGLHFQRPPFAQAKLVRCVEGEVLDIALDIRKGSPTYGKYCSVRLSATTHNQFFIPKGFAHGFAVLSESAVFQYKCDEYYAPQSEGGVNICDPALGLDLDRFMDVENLIISDKDRKYPDLRDFDSPFVLGENC